MHKITNSIASHEKFLKLNSILFESYGQSEPITMRLMNILREYPRGTQVFKEMLQNADDASATEFNILFDERVHVAGDDSKLLSQEMNLLQGMSLIAHNNAKFEEKDFESIRKLGDSRKKLDVQKTGRFGIGFNSVYHLTDFPCFVSGRHIVIFDPHRFCLPRALLQHGDPGTRVDFLQDEFYDKFSDQFAPFDGLFGCDLKSGKDEYNGTLFRFPLRNQEQSKLSQISETWYTREDILSLLESFSQEAALDILFLKHVQKIGVYHQEVGKPSPTKLFSISVDSDDEKRSRINRILENAVNLKTFFEDNKSLQYSYELSVTQQWYEKTGAVSRNNNQKWVVSCYLDTEGEAKDLSLKAFLNKIDARMIPFGQVGACIYDSDQPDRTNLAIDDARAYCFLPMPNSTGLSVHVNAFFELSSSRRDLWKGSATGLEGVAAIRAKWNDALIASVLGPAYTHLAYELRVRKDVSDAQLYSLFPKFDLGGLTWRPLIDTFYHILSQSSINMLRDLQDNLVSPMVSYLLDASKYDKNDLVVVEEWMTRNGCKILKEMQHFEIVKKGFEEAGVPLRVITPGLLRQMLKTQCNEEHLRSLDISLLLKFVTSDSNYEDLDGVQLIPLYDGTFGFFQKEARDMYYLVENDTFTVLNYHDRLKSKMVKALPRDPSRQILMELTKHISNLKELTPQDCSTLLSHSVIPIKWRTKRETEWDKAVFGEEFIRALVAYLATLTSEEQVHFDFPLLPTTIGTLFQLKKKRILLDRDNTVPKNVRSILEHFGIRFYDVQSSEDRLQLTSACLFSVLQALNYCIAKDEINVGPIIDKLLDTDKRSLVDWIAARWMIEQDKPLDQFKGLLQGLKIYENYKNQFVSLNESLKIEPENFRESDRFIFGSKYLKLASPVHRPYYRNVMKVKEMTKSQAYSERVFTRLLKLTDVQLEDIMLSVLEQISLLESECPGTIQTIKNLPFIQTKSGTRCRPVHLYDPRSSQLQELLSDSTDVFPCGKFEKSEYLHHLERLGMMNTLAPESFCSLVQKISTEANTVLAERLLTVLDSIEETLKSQSWKDAFESVRLYLWIPSKKLPASLSPLKINRNIHKQALAAHKAAAKFDDELLCSLIKPVCSVQLKSKVLLDLLEWDRMISDDVVCKQLEILSRKFISHSKALDKESDTWYQLCDEISRFSYAIYEHFETILSTVSSSELSFGSSIRSFDSVWLGDRFVLPSNMALSSTLKLAPHLFELPPNLTRFRKLINVMEIKKEFTTSDLITVLRKLPESEAQNVKLAIMILQSIYQETEFEQFVSNNNLLVPTVTNKFADSRHLIYVDSKEVFERVSSADVAFKERLVHQEISNAVAEKLGCLSLSNELEEESSELLLGEKFGQNEKLSTRIANILSDYPCTDSTIFKELLQNAEDAKATVFTIVYDRRTFGTNSLFNKSLAEFQGPSVLAYNNSVFTQEDILSIQQLGTPSKLKNLSAIGRFSLGFNACFNYGDVISFVSGDKLVMMDPQASYVRGASPSNPGRLYNFTKSGFLETFADQLAPFSFEQLGCNMKDEFKGTLFRIPLRSKHLAEISELSNLHWNESSIREQLAEFAKEARNCLLFLRNIQQINIIIQNDEDQQVLLELTAHKSHNMNTLQTYFNSYVAELKEETAPTQKTHKTKPRSKNKNKKAAQTPIRNGQIFDGTIDFKFKTGQDVTQETWMISSMVGGAKLHNMHVSTVQKLGRKFRMVPFGQVAVQIEPDTYKPVPLKGRAFSFLPLPIETGLNVHINSYFEMGSSRRELWYKLSSSDADENKNQDAQDPRNIWNMLLMSDAIAPALKHLVSLLLRYVDNIPKDNRQDMFYAIMELCPQKTTIGSNHLIMTILSSFYNNFETTKVYSAGKGKFESLAGVYVDSPPVANQQKGEGRTVLHASLTNDGFPLAIMPQGVIDELKQQSKIQFINPQTVRSFYSGQFQSPKLKDNYLATANPKSVKKLWKFCVSDEIVPALKLNNFPVLMRDGSISFLQPMPKNVTTKTCLFYCNSKEDMTLFEESDHKLFIDPQFVSHYPNFFNEANMKQLNVVPLSPQILAKFVLKDYPDLRCNEKTDTRYITIQDNLHLPSPDWLTKVWKYLDRFDAAEYEKHFSNIALIPTINQRLYPLDNRIDVFYQNEWNKSAQTLRNLLQLCGASIVEDSFSKTPSVRKFAKPISDQTLMLALKTVPKSQINHISKEDISSILHFFNPNQISSNTVTELSQLPFFELTSGMFVSLLGKKNVFIESRDERLPSTPDNITLLKAHKTLVPLYTAMGYKVASAMNLYHDLILPNFGQLYEQEKMEHLTFIRDDGRLFAYLKSSLENLKFLGPNNLTPKDFYDPSNSFFKRFLPSSKFPPAPFNSEEWIYFLSRCGLVSRIEPDTLMECCKRLPLTSKNSDVVRENADLLLQMLFNRSTAFTDDEQYLERLKTLKILPTSSYSDEYPAKSVLTSIEQSHSDRDGNLVFTCCELFDRKYENFVAMVKSKLRMPVKPKQTTVKKHLVNLIKISHSFPVIKMQTIVESIYTYLSSKSQVTSGVPSEPLIYSNGFFVEATLMFSRIDEDYPPHMYQVPESLIHHKKLFESWGVKEYPSEEFCYSVLKRLRVQTKKNQATLSPSDQQLALYVTRLLCTKYDKSVRGSFILTSTSKLEPHRYVMVDDAPFLHNRIDMTNMSIVHPELLDLADRLELQNLSNAVKEKVVLGSDSVETETDQTKQLQVVVSSPQFAAAVFRLVCHEERQVQKNKSLREKQNLQKLLLSLSSLLNNLNQVQIRVVPVLNAVYIDTRTQTDVTINHSGSRTNSLCFIDMQARKFYIADKLPGYVDIYALLAKELNKLMNYSLQDTSLLAGALRCIPDEIEEMLNSFHVTTTDNAVSTQDSQVLNRKVGSLVLEEDMIFFKTPATKETQFTVGELVAIVASDEGNTLKFAKIDSKIDTANYWVMVNESNKRTQTVKVTQIRKFINEDIEVVEEALVVIQQNNTELLREQLSQSLVCPITQEVFRDPVTASDGYTYERDAISSWLRNNQTSPMTRQIITRELIPNFTIRAMVRQFIDCD